MPNTNSRNRKLLELVCIPSAFNLYPEAFSLTQVPRVLHFHVLWKEVSAEHREKELYFLTEIQKYHERFGRTFVNWADFSNPKTR